MWVCTSTRRARAAIANQMRFVLFVNVGRVIQPLTSSRTKHAETNKPLTALRLDCPGLFHCGPRQSSGKTSNMRTVVGNAFADELDVNADEPESRNTIGRLGQIRKRLTKDDVCS